MGIEPIFHYNLLKRTTKDLTDSRKSIVVFLRHFVKENGKRIFTHQELSKIVDSPNRAVSSEYIRSFKAARGDFAEFLTRKKKINQSVEDALATELKTDPFAPLAQLVNGVNTPLGSSDLTPRNISKAIDGVPLRPFRSSLLQKIEKGEAHYAENYLRQEMMQKGRSDVGQRAGIEVEDLAGMRLSDPSAILSLFSSDVPIHWVSEPLKWLSFIMALYYHGLPLSVIGKWAKCPQNHGVAIDTGSDNSHLADGLWLAGLLCEREYRFIRDDIGRGGQVVNEVWT